MLSKDIIILDMPAKKSKTTKIVKQNKLQNSRIITLALLVISLVVALFVVNNFTGLFNLNKSAKITSECVCPNNYHCNASGKCIKDADGGSGNGDKCLKTYESCSAGGDCCSGLVCVVGNRGEPQCMPKSYVKPTPTPYMRVLRTECTSDKNLHTTYSGGYSSNRTCPVRCVKGKEFGKDYCE